MVYPSYTWVVITQEGCLPQFLWWLWKSKLFLILFPVFPRWYQATVGVCGVWCVLPNKKLCVWSRRAFARNRISIVAQGHTIAHDVGRNSTGLEATIQKCGSSRDRPFSRSRPHSLNSETPDAAASSSRIQSLPGKRILWRTISAKIQPTAPLHTRSIEGGRRRRRKGGRKKSRISNIKKVIKSNKSAGKYRSEFWKGREAGADESCREIPLLGGFRGWWLKHCLDGSGVYRWSSRNDKRGLIKSIAHSFPRRPFRGGFSGANWSVQTWQNVCACACACVRVRVCE